MQYLYTARDKMGNIKTGSGDFADEKALAIFLRDQGLLLTKAEAQTPMIEKKSIIKKIPFINRVSLMDKIFFTQNLQVMMKAGVSLSQTLKTLGEQTTNKTLQAALMQIKNMVEAGQPLSRGLMLYPKIFPELYVNMVAAGEASGKLEETLGELLLQMKKDHELMSKIKGAMLYPAVIFVVMIAVMIAMMVFIIPNLTSIFLELKAQLPLPTRLVMWLSDFLIHQGIWVAILLSVILIIFRYFTKKTVSGRK